MLCLDKAGVCLANLRDRDLSGFDSRRFAGRQVNGECAARVTAGVGGRDVVAVVVHDRFTDGPARPDPHRRPGCPACL